MSSSDVEGSTEVRVLTSMYRAGGKRVLDTTLALVLLVGGAPLLALLALGVRLTLGSPVLFRQARAGRDGVAFRLCKLRTMSDARDPRGELLDDARRTTAFGRFLRRTSLDELPELYHVLLGQMSLVGPRPLPLHYLPHYSAEQSRRHLVRPGLTGWAQVNGRNAIGWTERFERDVWYVDNLSPWLDLRILGRTVLLVLRRTDIDPYGGGKMHGFRGDEHAGSAGKAERVENGR